RVAAGSAPRDGGSAARPHRSTARGDRDVFVRAGERRRRGGERLDRGARGRDRISDLARLVIGQVVGRAASIPYDEFTSGAVSSAEPEQQFMKLANSTAFG